MTGSVKVYLNDALQYELPVKVNDSGEDVILIVNFPEPIQCNGGDVIKTLHTLGDRDD